MQKTPLKNTKYSRNESNLKIGRFAKREMTIAHAKSLLLVKNKTSKKHVEIHSTNHLQLFCAKNRSKKDQIFENETIFKIGHFSKAIALLSGRANFSYSVSLENALRRLRAGHGNLSSWDMHHLPEAPLWGAIFLPCKRSVPPRDYYPRESFRRYDLPENVNV